jgi:hypothetical protein
MFTTILTGVVGLIGIAGTILAWNLNPKRKVYAELDSIYQELYKNGGLYERRDKALASNNSDELSIVNELILRVCARQAVLLKRLG